MFEKVGKWILFRWVLNTITGQITGMSQHEKKQTGNTSQRECFAWTVQWVLLGTQYHQTGIEKQLSLTGLI